MAHGAHFGVPPVAPGGAVDPFTQQLIDAGLVDDQAQLLAQQMKHGMGLLQTPGAMGANVGGTYVASSPLEHLSVALSRAMGGRMAHEAQQGMQKGIDTRRAGRQAFAERQAGLPAIPNAEELLAPPAQPTWQPPSLAGPQTVDGVTAPPPTAAQRLAAAMDARERLGQAGVLSGDPIISAGGQGLLGEVKGLRAQDFGGQEGKLRLAQAAAQQRAEQEYRGATLAETERAHRADEGLKRAALDQDLYRFGADPTGGGIIYNAKTGERASVGANGAFPGAPAGLKPAQFEADVQSLGKDLEPIQKAVPDIATLRAATEKSDVAGFGPVEGVVPDMLTSSEGVANRQAAGRLMAAIIQATSGQVASEKEVERLLKANGMGPRATREQLKQGVAKLEAQYEALRKQREAKYHPSVVSTYRERGGYTMTPGAAPATTATADAPPVPGAFKTKSGKWAVMNAQGQAEYVEGK